LTGIIANAQSVIFVPEANKTTQFIKLCNASNTPIIYLHNVTGFMVGAKTESQGLIKAGAQLVNAVSNSKVRKVYDGTHDRFLRSVSSVAQVTGLEIMPCVDGLMILDSCFHGRLDDAVSWVRIS
jgi:hypothetical protein